MSNPDPIAEPLPPSGGVESAAGASGADQLTIVSAVDSGGLARQEPVAPPRIEGYEIYSELHRGGQGVVYRAMQLGTKRMVALKVLLEGPFASESARRRFEREVELAASLRHASIVTILDSGISQGRYFFAMEFIDGERLDQYLDRARPPLKQTVALLGEICGAVHFAHQRGVIHRDLKPSNILVDAEGRPRILDFGLAKTTVANRDPNETAVAMLSTTGQILGTLAYMSPEQAAGSDDLDVRSDVYALGVVFYEALLGQTPYSISGPLGQVLNRIASDEPVAPRALKSNSRYGPLIDDELETILLKALEKDRARRYQSAGELGRDLQHYLLGEPIEAKRASGLYVLRKTLKRYRIQAAAAGIILMTLIGALAMFVVLYRRETKLHEQAEALQQLADQRTQRAEVAEARQSEALRKEERASAEATRAAEELRQALALQTIQRGDLAAARGDLAEARQSYWQAYSGAPQSPAAHWALRQYYLESADQGALQLSFGSFGPASISDDGALVALCDTSESVRLCATGSGQTLAWMPAPGPISFLTVDQGQRCVLGGRGWLGLWEPPGYEQPRVVRWSNAAAPSGVAVSEDATLAVALVGRDVHSVRLSSGQVEDSTQLEGDVTGPAVATRRGALVVPTSRGVELVTLTGGGTLTHAILWKGGKPARSVAPHDMAIRVLSDAVYETALRAALAVDTHPVLTPGDQWSLIDWAAGGEVALATDDGRVAVFADAKLVFDLHLAEAAPAALRIVDNGNALLTLNRRGVLTRWDWRSAERKRQVVHSQAVSAWTISRDGSAAFLMQADGATFAIRAAGAQPVRQLMSARPMAGLVRGREIESRLRTSTDGRVAVIQSGNKLSAAFSDAAATVPIRSNHPDLPTLRDFAVSLDGSTLALLSESAQGDRQAIELRSLSFNVLSQPSTYNDARARLISLQGGNVRGVAFLTSSDLLACRLNGELVHLPLDEPASENGGREVWATLDTPAYQIEFDRQNIRLAAACDDGIVRVLSVLDTSELARINVGRQVYGLSFDPS